MRRTHIFGNAETTPGVVTPPATLNTDPLDVGDDTTGLTFAFSDSAPDDQIALQIIDTDGSTVVMEVRPKYTTIIDRKLGASYGVFDNPACLNGTVAPVCIDLAGAGRIWGGVGAPGTTFTGTGRVGDVFLRTDGSAGTYYYLCTTAGTPGTWTAYA